MLFSSGFTEVAKAGTGATWPSNEPVKAIDHIYVGPVTAWVRGGAVVAGERVASDHRAVVGTLRRAPRR
jgi:endonuclease/exonuclease/phosphatase family metal-dependent hydrolase